MRGSFEGSRRGFRVGVDRGASSHILIAHIISELSTAKSHARSIQLLRDILTGPKACIIVRPTNALLLRDSLFLLIPEARCQR